MTHEFNVNEFSESIEEDEKKWREDEQKWRLGLSEFFQSIAAEIYKEDVMVMPCIEWEDVVAALGDGSNILKTTVDMSALSDEAVASAVAQALGDVPSPPIGMLVILYGRRDSLHLKSIMPLRNAARALCSTALCTIHYDFQGDVPGRLAAWYRL